MKMSMFSILLILSSSVFGQNSADYEIGILNKTRQRLISEIDAEKNYYQNYFQLSINDLQDSLQNSFQVITKNKRDSINLINQTIVELIKTGLSARVDALLSGEETVKALVKFPGNIRNSNNPNASLIEKVNTSDTLLVINYVEGYYKVKIETTYGYINEMFILEAPNLLTFKENKLANNESMRPEIEKIKSEFKNAIKLEEKYWNPTTSIELPDYMNTNDNEEHVDYQKVFDQLLKDKLIKKFGKETGENLYSGSYWIGMPADMAKKDLGPAERITKSIGSWGVSETWIYNGSLNLYFENGILRHYFTSSDW